jgi:hypothetical protein
MDFMRIYGMISSVTAKLQNQSFFQQNAKGDNTQFTRIVEYPCFQLANLQKLVLKSLLSMINSIMIRYLVFLWIDKLR